MNQVFKNFCFDDGSVVEGLTNELTIFYMVQYFRKFKQNVLVLANTLFEANQIYRQVSTYISDVLFFPMDDFLTSVAVAVSPELKLKRLETLEKLGDEKPHFVVTNLMGYLKFNPSVKNQKDFSFELGVNQVISRDEFISKLDSFGYKRDSLVTSTGEYAVRGFVVDVFPIHYDHPVRIEFFGDEIESIRYFDEDSQRSLDSISSFNLHVMEELQTEEYSSLLDYMPEATLIVYNKQQIFVGYQKLFEEMTSYNERENTPLKRYFYQYEELVPSKTLFINTIGTDLESTQVIRYSSKEMPQFHGNFESLKELVESALLKKKKVVFCLSKASEAKIIAKLFSNVQLLSDDQRELKQGVIHILPTKINQGFFFEDYVVISEFDIEERKQEVVYKNNFHMGRKIHSIDSLKTGDYVVHLTHGIGIYCGVVTLENRGLKKDYVQVAYQGSDKVYIPVEKISTIYKYSDQDGMKPQINKLGSTAWVKKKRSIQKRIKDISEELIKLYAARKNVVSDAYQDYPEEDVFASTFPYEETRDQNRAIEDISKDLDSSVPMDRLLCGDVGFGKTEVAFRAIFKAILNNKQVFYLCPTTILSKQQYESAVNRFRDYPIEIALLNRFTSFKETKRILEDLKSGKIDLVFGTHRLLSDDVHFKKLGLLVVDEEQRFGVTHKEKIKKYKNDVNVLTLSATPIPRTLKMALSGLRDLSIIDTPPVNRYPVQTYVIAENDLIVKDAIYKELARNGQVFLLYNKIDTIEEKLDQIKKLVPEARIRYAHGRMSKIELENIMNDFVDHQFDLLLSTTIIETGIDIPNANTLIIYDADHFGLSQLYQLRGRVGRSNKIAYAYFMYQKNKTLNDVAVKRLNAIRDFTELGSGYKIAMRDLSIRGAGDLLGSEQAGFVDSVGIQLYLKMIEEEMKRLKGEEVLEQEEDSDISLVNVETHIKDEYVSDEDMKIVIHQKINEIDSEKKFLEIKEELTDRFGAITKEMEIYMYEEWFEKLARSLKITHIQQTDREVAITIPEEFSAQIKGDKLFLEAYNIHPKFVIQYFNKQIVIKLPLKVLEKHFLYYLVPLFSKIVMDLEV